MNKCRFTMTDLLVTLVVIAVLATLVWPLAADWHQGMRKSACASQQRLIYAAAAGFADDRGRLPVYAGAYIDVLEGERADGELARFLRDHADVATTSEGMLTGNESAQLALEDWSQSIMYCPAAAPPERWWFGKFHHAMEPWETLSYQLNGLDLLAAREPSPGRRLLSTVTEPAGVVFSQDQALDEQAAEMAAIFGDARRNNHKYLGSNIMAMDGHGTWQTSVKLTPIRELQQQAGGHYRTSHPLDGYVAWWQTEHFTTPSSMSSMSTGGHIYRADGDPHAATLQAYRMPETDDESPLAETVRRDARALGYLAPDSGSDTSDRRPQAD